jgi:hypothetical protein
MNARRYGVVALLACALLILVSVASMRSGSAESIVRALVAHTPCDETKADLACWENYYDGLIKQHGAKVALFDLKARYERGGSPHTYCHTFLHDIGAAAAHEYGSIAEAYANGDTFCRAGYYHGVLEGVFGHEGGERLLSELDSICATVEGKERYSYAYFSCVHGIGHGLMAYFDHNVFKSLEGCDRLSQSWEQASCYGGVFMENIMSDSAESPSVYLKKDDVMYPCTVVDTKYRRECYLMQTSHVLELYAGDFEAVFRACSSVEEEFRTSCFQSIGRDASSWSRGEPGTVNTYCAQGTTPDARLHCLVGAAVDFIQSVGVYEARSLCQFAGPALQAECTEALEKHIRAL